MQEAQMQSLIDTLATHETTRQAEDHDARNGDDSRN